ncbi:hypothetical protein CSPAE12_01467 [Colletotrichum incanum]|nr:hypothetical protein CSPAE12_01467 [Colletotrichum incanum]
MTLIYDPNNVSFWNAVRAGGSSFLVLASRCSWKTASPPEARPDQSLSLLLVLGGEHLAHGRLATLDDLGHERLHSPRALRHAAPHEREHEATDLTVPLRPRARFFSSRLRFLEVARDTPVPTVPTLPSLPVYRVNKLALVLMRDDAATETSSGMSPPAPPGRSPS